jgi:hypothetical protein
MKWINFDEEKPLDREYVLAVTSEDEMLVAYFDKDWSNCLCQCDGYIKIFNITYWMSLPDLPSRLKR